MGKAAREREQLNRALGQHLNNIHETLQALDESPPLLDKVSWNKVIELAEQLSKQATNFGMLWTGEIPEVKVLEENMDAYFNHLQGVLLLSHACKVGAGATLSSCIQTSIKQVVDSSFMLMKDSVSSYGSTNKNAKLSVPQLVGTVWEACSALKKTPVTNIMAVGRAITQVAVSMKDVLHEMNELEMASSDPSDEASVGASSGIENRANNSDDSFALDIGNDLSPEEMQIAKLTVAVVSELLGVMKELIRSISGLRRQESGDDSADLVNSLEKLRTFCQGIGVQVDELGACLYPPQEISTIKAACGKISDFLDKTEMELENLGGSSEGFVQACTGLRSSLKQLESQLDCSDAPALVSEMEKLVVSS